MGERRGAREWALQVLFQEDFNPGELQEDFAEFWTDKHPSERARQFAEDLVRGVLANREQIDKRLQGYAENWALHRMSGVDRNLMRLALYELLYREDIPPVVTINEAVDIAKAFSGEDSGRFVNGILDRARKDLTRPARTAVGGVLPPETPPGAPPAAGEA
jgi:N utilization substance protein B